VLGRPECLSSSTDNQLALKSECHSKTAVRLKEFKGFGSRFTKLHAKLDMLLNFAIHRRQNKTRSQKSTRVKTMRVHSAVSCGRLMQ
jgi:hypothetical protein